MRKVLCLCVLAGCASERAIDPADAIDVSSGDAIDFDDLRWSPDLGRVLVPAGGLDHAVVIDPASRAAVDIGDGDAVQSVDGGAGLVFELARGARRIDVFDAASGERVAQATLEGGGLDYVRFSASRRELWVTEPGASRVEILAVDEAGTPSTVAAVDVASPEGLVIDDVRGVAYTHSRGELAAIDLATRAVTRWPTGCDGDHGFPQVDVARGLVFAGCQDAEVVVLDAASGEVRDRHHLGGGATILAYSEALHHFYLKADPGQTVQILGVSADGTLELLGELLAGRQGHCMAADDRGGLWVCDASRGRILRFDDPYPATGE
jgi:hypothetical protein